MYKALKSFSGVISMTKGQEKDIQDKATIEDLLRAGYIEEIKPEVKDVKKEVQAEIKNIVEKVETKAKEKKSKKKSK